MTTEEQSGEERHHPDDHHKAHRILSGHRCSCGWEGDSATTHIIDTLGIREVCVVCGLTEAYCEGPLHVEHEHDYEPLFYVTVFDR